MTSFEALLETFNAAAWALHAVECGPVPMNVQTPRYRLLVGDYENALKELDLALGRRPAVPTALPSPRKEAEKEAEKK